MPRISADEQGVFDFDPSEFKSMKCFQTIRTANQLVVEMSFDPGAKLLAVGTSDSQIKVFDVLKGF